MPGSSHKSWNKEVPVLRILMRAEQRPELAHQGDPHEFEVLQDCTAALAQQHPQQQVGYAGSYAWAYA